MELPQGGASEHVSKPCPGNFPTEGTPDSRGNCSVFPPAPHPGESFAACILLWEVSFRFIFSGVFFFFFPQLLFLVVNPCFGWAAKQLLCWSSQHTPAGKYFPARFLKTLQSQQNLPQRVAKGSTLITQLGAGERDDIDGKETLCLGSSGKEASWLRKKHWGSGQVSTIDAISKSN